MIWLYDNITHMQERMQQREGLKLQAPFETEFTFKNEGSIKASLLKLRHFLRQIQRIIKYDYREED